MDLPSSSFELAHELANGLNGRLLLLRCRLLLVPLIVKDIMHREPPLDEVVAVVRAGRALSLLPCGACPRRWRQVDVLQPRQPHLPLVDVGVRIVLRSCRALL